MSNWGTVVDYDTGMNIRVATAQDWRRTADKRNSSDGDAATGAWLDEDGHAVWVTGGPDGDVAGDDIRKLRDAAAQAGDDKQVSLCTIALGEDTSGLPWQWSATPDQADAYWACAQVILDARMNFNEA